MSSIISDTAEIRLPARQVLQRYNVVDRTLARWLENPNLDFPKPIEINKRRYWRLGDLQAWESRRSASSAKAA